MDSTLIDSPLFDEEDLNLGEFREPETPQRIETMEIQLKGSIFKFLGLEEDRWFVFKVGSYPTSLP